MPGYRAIIFDFGGVLVRMVDETPRLRLAEKWGVSLARIDELVFFSKTSAQASLGEIPVSRHWQVVAETLGVPPEEMPAFLQEYWSADDVNYLLLGAIRFLHTKEFKIGLLSNAWDDLRTTMHNRWGMDALFDEMVISAEVGMVKPDPRIFHRIVDRLGVTPAEAVFIDDMPVNVEAARREGLAAIQYLDPRQCLTELSALLELPLPA